MARKHEAGPVNADARLNKKGRDSYRAFTSNAACTAAYLKGVLSRSADDEGGASWRVYATNGTRNWFENLTTGARMTVDNGPGPSLEFCAFFYAETRFNTQKQNYGWSPPHPLSHWHNLLHQRRRQCRRFKAHFIFRRKLILPIILALTQSRNIAVNG